MTDPFAIIAERAAFERDRLFGIMLCEKLARKADDDADVARPGDLTLRRLAHVHYCEAERLRAYEGPPVGHDALRRIQIGT